MNHRNPQDIWYRNPMVWLVVSIPLATIIGCLATITIAITHPDTLIERVADTEMAAEQ
ncbi:MAG: hypothetical protein AAFX44_03400 [Pseudomonadota bacterium]